MIERIPPPEADRPREACGVFGVVCADGSPPVATMAVQGLLTLQHRGEDGAGVIVGNTQPNNEAYPYIGVKGVGLITQAIPDGGTMLDRRVPGAKLALAHNRYGTSHGARDPFSALQPFLEGPLALIHNGNMPNAYDVAASYGLDPEHYVTDSHAALGTLAHIQSKRNNLDESIAELFPQLYGGFSVVVAEGDRLIAIRDRQGFRPFFIGELPDKGGHVFASEIPALHAVGATVKREVRPGEIVQSNGTELTSTTFAEPEPAGCGFEYAYISRADGHISGTDLTEVRLDLGRILAEEHPRDVDLVVGAPESGVLAAAGYAEASGIPLKQYAITLNRYASDRSFIKANQLARANAVRQKMRLNQSVLEGQRLLLVDDSLVRGTTMRATIKMLRDIGVKEVHVLFTWPPFLNPCFYGIDVGNPRELLAPNRTIEEMAEEVGADSLGFISVDGTKRAIGSAAGKLCMACATGEYPQPGSGQLVDLPLPVVRR